MPIWFGEIVAVISQSVDKIAKAGIWYITHTHTHTMKDNNKNVWLLDPNLK